MLHHSCQFDEEVKLRVRFWAEFGLRMCHLKILYYCQNVRIRNLRETRSSVCNTGIGYENTKYFCRPVSFVCLFAISRTGFVHVSINCCGCSSPKPDCPLTLPSPPLAFGTVFFKPLSVNCNVYSPSGNMEVRFPELHIEVCPQDLDLDTAMIRIERSAM